MIGRYEVGSDINEFLRFRHIVRHMFAFELDPERVECLASRLRPRVTAWETSADRTKGTDEAPAKRRRVRRRRSRADGGLAVRFSLRAQSRARVSRFCSSGECSEPPFGKSISMRSIAPVNGKCATG